MVRESNASAQQVSRSTRYGMVAAGMALLLGTGYAAAAESERMPPDDPIADDSIELDGSDCILGGETNPVRRFVVGDGAVSFDIDVNGDMFGSTHSGTITCSRPITIASETRNDGGGFFSGAAQGNIYTWRTQCANFAGVHYTIQLKY